MVPDKNNPVTTFILAHRFRAQSIFGKKVVGCSGRSLRSYYTQEPPVPVFLGGGESLPGQGI